MLVSTYEFTQRQNPEEQHCHEESMFYEAFFVLNDDGIF
jgi:hypothetical protein